MPREIANVRNNGELLGSHVEISRRSSRPPIAVSRRLKNQRGNQMLESALCFLPMMALFFGFIDVCYAVSIQSLLAAATRAGSRWAVTYQSTYDGAACTSQAA